MTISPENLIAIGVAPTLAKNFAQPLQAACDRFEINTPLRVAAFLAQCLHESQILTHMEENCYYSSPERILKLFSTHVHGPEDAISLTRNPQAFANRMYANRMGNGDEASGDGWRFRGSGLLMLTGREEHTKAAAAFVTQLEVFSDLARTSIAWACKSAAWFWAEHHGLNALADNRDIDAISKIVNGGTIGLAERRETYRIAVAQLCDAPRAVAAVA